LLLDSYIRHERWREREQAIQVINAYAEAMSGGKQARSGGNAGLSDTPVEMMGVKVKHANKNG